ncbi:RING finger domain-containing protein [Boeremia exigua]|uniref:RING finger domain-containing protein n=1 Tax=Boeremia exigua TaxID=749465 RepID=UPI001E8DCAF8|nr:RING finger domain-containing protein [Boeremia exigua]KAH6625816.1 RING finger domain-containing protein [Boeremia exigua]
MAEARRGSGVQGDLEKELTCSICTDLLYQPLTLLDCLHTFCGACLKEWFSFQASAATSIHPYTCPSCRASVRSTQPNATVTTLLDIFLKANPGRGKSDEEKKADKEKYRPGDNVLPKLRRRGGPEDEDDRRVLEEVQQLSLREVGIPSSSNHSLEPPRERRRHERSREGSRESRRTTSRNTSPSRAVAPARTIEHQASLRSLLSASDLGADEVDEDLVRHVLEELLAEGVDLNDIGTTQEEEITERIAEAVRRRQAERQSERHSERQRERRERRERLAREGLMSSSQTSLPQPIRSAPLRDEDASRRRGQGRSESRTSTPQNGTRHGPPISRPGLIDAANDGSRQHRRSSSQGSSRSARRADRPPTLGVSSSRQSANGQERESTSDNVTVSRRRQSDNQQSGSAEARQQFRRSIYDSMAAASPVSPLTTGFNIPGSDSPVSTLTTFAPPLHPSPSSPPAETPFRVPSLRRITDPASGRPPRISLTGTPPLVSPPSFLRSATDPNVNEIRSRQASDSTPSTPILHAEPHVSCKSCGKDHIEYELHYSCQRCDDGNYNICLRCFRIGKGCRHWFGFGWAAWLRYERQTPQGGYPPNDEHPHVLTGRRYRRPLAQLVESTLPPHELLSEHNPDQRKELGVFCDICKAFANACYWKCDYCNEGEWGYCNDCINQGRHCTHPLLPVAHKSQTDLSDSPELSLPSTPHANTDSLAPPDHDYEATTPPLTPKTASLMRGPILFTIANLTFRPLTFTTLCNICRYPIPPSNTRYHCLKCNAGDYDVCMACYHKLVVSNRISKENGINGWRKCFRGHRMVVVGFEDRDGGQLRIVVKDLVGGWALKDDEDQARSPTSRAPQRYPPDGGTGLRLQARWGHWPEEGVRDELAFPKISEIREAADVNGEWYWGVYCGMVGLFPASHVATV